MGKDVVNEIACTVWTFDSDKFSANITVSTWKGKEEKRGVKG